MKSSSFLLKLAILLGGQDYKETQTGFNRDGLERLMEGEVGGSVSLCNSTISAFSGLKPTLGTEGDRPLPSHLTLTLSHLSWEACS